MPMLGSLTTYPLFINGRRREPSIYQYMPVTNPATGHIIGQVAMGDEADVDLAVESAAAAFAKPEWRKMPVVERSTLLYALGNAVLANARELAELEVASSGGTISRIMGMDIPAVADLFFVLAQEVKTFPMVETLSPRPLSELIHTQVRREPVGICGLITAWNFPLLLLAWKLAPALAAGNTVVIKPAELTPASTFRMVELLDELLPAGVLNIVTGLGGTVGEAMIRHPKIDKISFTGSTAVGKHIQKVAAESLKRVALELGGKGPAIVMPDVEIERVAYGVLFAFLLNAGQACESGTRLLVHEDIHDTLLQKMVEVAGQIVIGNPIEPGTSIGPMSSEMHFNKVMSYIESARAQGARIVCGGCRVEVPGCEGGYFIGPTIIADATNDMEHVREEIFGPVISVIKYKTLDEAIAIANDSSYGLSAGIWAEDVVQAQVTAQELRAGSVWINDWHMLRNDAPFGGFKQSGYGREMSKHGLSAYTELKAVSTAFERVPAKKPGYHLVHKNFG